VEDDEGRDSFLSRGNSPPLADVLCNSKSTEVDSVGAVGRGVAGRARDEYVVCGLRAASRFLRRIVLRFPASRALRAGIAIATALPLGSFAEVAANVTLAALFGLHETLDSW